LPGFGRAIRWRAAGSPQEAPGLPIDV